MRNLKKRLAMLMSLVCLMTAAGCADKSPVQESSGEAAEHSAASGQSADSSAAQAELTKADQNTKWDDSAVTLKFDGTTVTPSASDGVSVENGVVTIRKGGDYVLSGTLDDGRVIVDLTDNTEKAHLIFNGVSISSSTSAALTVLQADKTIITLADGTENSLSDAAAYSVFDIEESDGSTYPNACIASKDDLTINGGGALTVCGNYNNGIHCADDLKIVSGTITVTAENHGIRGNDSVLLHDGAMTVDAGGDGIKSSNADTEGKGYVYIEGGALAVTAAQDGIDAATSLTVTGGSLEITAGGGTANATAHADDMMGGFGGMGGGFGHGGGFGGPRRGFDDSGIQPTANNQPSAAAADMESSGGSVKGIKADGVLTISGGSLSINAADDGVHSNSAVCIFGADVTIAAGDDGIHADSTVSISGGEIRITESYEGIEAAEINVSGGDIHVKSSDDGINASDGSGGGGFNRNSSGMLEISGGYIYVDADGDGLDSNGDIMMTGGTVIVCGPTSSADGALDSGDNNNTITVTGGTLIALGAVGMMETPETNYLAATNLNAAAGTLIVVTDEDGAVLCAFETPKQAQGIVFSADGMSDGYYIYTGGDYSGTRNADGFGTGGSYSGGTLISSGSGGMMGGGFGGRGNRDFGGNNPDEMTPPGGFDGNLTPPEGFDDNMSPPEGADGSMEPPGFGYGGFGDGAPGHRS